MEVMEQLAIIHFGGNAYNFSHFFNLILRWSVPIAKLGTGSFALFKPSKTDGG